jgi:hypothetical protein
MRKCEACSKPDAPALEYEGVCKPDLCPPTADERPETHHDACPRLIHEVRRLYRPAVLVHTPAHPEGQLETKWLREGWVIVKDGRDVFRMKMLCRACILKVYEREANHKEYVKACNRAMGDDGMTYSQLLARQANA